ncbi:MAG: DUF934 domain-containing protein [Betaproteobacteria bacterium]|nr:DUF934 domain-containing protein [Betaproteobacteria bacterium]
MSKYIKNRLLADDNWTHLGASCTEMPAGNWIVPLAFWRANKEHLMSRIHETGVILEPAEDPKELAGVVGQLPVIAIRFPSFTDGRGYSSARLLRERHGFKGEVRAVGDVWRDQVFLMERCGFDAFELREDQDVAVVLAAFEDFSEVYQAANDRGPLFARRFG